MAVPDYQSIMLPLLNIAGDGNEYSLNEAIEILAQQIGLNEIDRNEMLPSGIQRKFDNRVSWARTYMQKDLFLSSPGRSKFRITERGIQVLKDHPTQINVKFLRQFPEIVAFHTHANRDGKTRKTTIQRKRYLKRRVRRLKKS